MGIHAGREVVHAMDDATSSTQPESVKPVSPQPKQADLEEIVTKAFVGPNGIRAGWRILIFLVIVGALIAGAGAIAMLFAKGKQPNVPFNAGGVGVSEGILFVCALVASVIMAKIEGRRVADYGLPVSEAFGKKFWQGTLIGFASITALLLAMRLVRVFYFGTIALQRGQIVKYAALWALAFLMVGFLEEFLFRGYALFTATTGITFWPAAILSSLLFGYVHHGNSGENWLGAFNAGAVGFLFCLILRRTGSLWVAVGFHAAWDWGETYFYGVPDSGLVAPGHLFNPSFSGPVWLTGGSVGPEGSWLCLALIVILWVIFATCFPEVKYPNPAAIPDPRRRQREPLSILAAPEQ
jgi:membrane protease YdiL (CAAX protease family)